jgi:hypothetical protein
MPTMQRVVFVILKPQTYDGNAEIALRREGDAIYPFALF